MTVPSFIVAGVMFLALHGALVVHAQQPVAAWLAALPTAEEPVHFVTSADSLEVSASGMVDERVERWMPRRTSARRHAERRGRAMLHRWVDSRLARLRLHPQRAQAVHDALSQSLRITGVRSLVDGSCLMRLQVPVDGLNRAAGEEIAW